MMTKSAKSEWKYTLNFWLTNPWPRRTLSRWMGRLSRLQSRSLTWLAIWIWNRFDRLELEDSPIQRFDSIQACFTRPIRPETRPLDTRLNMLLSPCDGLLVAHGPLDDQRLHQIKGKTYHLEELVGSLPADHPWRQGYFVTIRIKSNMYHRFHAPASGALIEVRHFAGDSWNVNPPTLARVSGLYVKNERACLTYRLDDGTPMALIPVAAILVAGIRVHALHHMNWIGQTEPIRISPPAACAKGQELGWFEHGSTIVLVMPMPCRLAPGLALGDRLYMGQALVERMPQIA